jgi:molybdate transport system substrate-binding protein
MRTLRPHTTSWRAGIWAIPLLLIAFGAGSCDKHAPKKRVNVFAASSLTETFRALETEFERERDVDVELNFAGSQVLRMQIEQGARADVFASANADHMQALVNQGLVSEPQTFAYNRLCIIEPADSPTPIVDFDGLSGARRIVLGTESVPVGRYTEEMFRLARHSQGDAFVDAVRDSVVSRETNVRLVRAKVEMGEADAAIVYCTDAAASDRVRSIAVPDELNPRASYPIATVVGASAEARAFVAFVASSQGKTILESHGFTTPD